MSAQLRPAFTEAFGALVTDNSDYRRNTLQVALQVPDGKEPSEYYPGLIEFILPVGQGAAALTAVLHLDPNEPKVKTLVESFETWERDSNRTDGDLEELSDQMGHSVTQEYGDDGWTSSGDSFDLSAIFGNEAPDTDVTPWCGSVEGIAHSIDDSLPNLQVFLDWCITNEAGQLWLAQTFVCLAWAHKIPAISVNLFTPTRKESR